jgi:cell division septum initiation protein DivIVA
MKFKMSSTIENLQSENYRLKQQLTQLKQHAQNLETILNSIKSAKAFKL